MHLGIAACVLPGAPIPSCARTTTRLVTHDARGRLKAPSRNHGGSSASCALILVHPPVCARLHYLSLSLWFRSLQRNFNDQTSAQVGEHILFKASQKFDCVYSVKPRLPRWKPLFPECTGQTGPVRA